MIIALYLLILFVLIDSPIFIPSTSSPYSSMKIEIMGSKKLLVGKAAFNNESRPHSTLHITPHNNRSNSYRQNLGDGA